MRVVEVEAFHAEERGFKRIEFVDQGPERGASMRGFAKGVDHSANELERGEEVVNGEAEAYGHDVLCS
jgi:hypothetical protein